MMPNQTRKLKIKKKLPTSQFLLNLKPEVAKWKYLELTLKGRIL
jgi:hypothetical protein